MAVDNGVVTCHWHVVEANGVMWEIGWRCGDEIGWPQDGKDIVVKLSDIQQNKTVLNAHCGGIREFA
jgi:hypothetical protein